MVEQPGVPEEGALIGPTGAVIGEFFPNEILIQASGEGRGGGGEREGAVFEPSPDGHAEAFFFR